MGNDNNNNKSKETNNLLNQINQINKINKINQIESTGDILSIKSKYILKIIFSYIQTKKELLIIKVNKKIQQRLDIDINQYQNYSGENSSIEFEIKPLQIKSEKIINILNEKDAKYYHIYFNNINNNTDNNNYIETKKNFLKKNHKLSTIKIAIEHQIKTLSKLFYNCKYIEEINFKKFCRNDIPDMSYMFYGCEALKKILYSLSSISNITNMSFLFSRCSSLTQIDLNNFNTEHTLNMKGIFSNCTSLEKIDLTQFKTNEVINMSSMFDGCYSLEELDLSNFNTNNVTDMSYMFRECSRLKKLNISNFNTKKVINMNSMFYNISQSNEFEYFNREKFIINPETNYYYMFGYCTSNIKRKMQYDLFHGELPIHAFYIYDYVKSEPRREYIWNKKK